MKGDIVDKMTLEEINRISKADGEERKQLWSYVIDKYQINLYNSEAKK